MKTIAQIFGILLISVMARGAENFLPQDGWVAHFMTGENLSRVEYTVAYPNTLQSRIRDGKYEGLRTRGDCLALIYSFADVPVNQMLELAASLKVSSGYLNSDIKELKPQVKNGTVFFELPNIAYYLKGIQVATRDQQSFTENKLRVLGPDLGANLGLRYLRNCREIFE